MRKNKAPVSSGASCEQKSVPILAIPYPNMYRCVGARARACVRVLYSALQSIQCVNVHVCVRAQAAVGR